MLSSSSTQDQSELQASFPQIFPVLSDIFFHFAGQRRKDEGDESTAGITFAEFSHFLHTARLEHAYKDTKKIKEYIATTKRKLDGSAAAGEERKGEEEESVEMMSMTEFLAAVVVVALDKADGTMRSAASLQVSPVLFIESELLLQTACWRRETAVCTKAVLV